MKLHDLIILENIQRTTASCDSPAWLARRKTKPKFSGLVTSLLFMVALAILVAAFGVPRL